MRNHTQRISRARQAAVAGATLVAVGGALHVTTDRAAATGSGLTFYPSTDIYAKNNFHFDADSFGKGTRMDSFTSVGVEYGAGPDKTTAFGRTELGLDYAVSIGGATPIVSGGNRLSFNAKTQLFNDEAKGTRVVAGVWGFGSKKIGSPNVGYLLGSKAFPFGRVHLGVAHAFAKKAIVTTPGGSSDRTYLQLGYDKAFAKGKWIFTTDFYSGKSSISTFSPGLIWAFAPNADVQVGYIRYNDSSIGAAGPAFTRNQVYLGFDYTFGPTPAAAPAAAPAATTGGAGGGGGGGGGGG